MPKRLICSTAMRLAVSMSSRWNGLIPFFGSAPEEEIPPDAHQRDGADVLMHGRDAAAQRIARVGELGLHAVEQDGAAARLVEAGQDLDQRRLAGAVVAEQADDLAGRHRHGDVGQRLHAGETLGDVAQLDQRCGFCRRHVIGSIGAPSACSACFIVLQPELIARRRK